MPQVLSPVSWAGPVLRAAWGLLWHLLGRGNRHRPLGNPLQPLSRKTEKAVAWGVRERHSPPTHPMMLVPAVGLSHVLEDMRTDHGVCGWWERGRV